MKKNIFLFAGVVLFVALFYQQAVAINLSIFCVVVWGMLCWQTPAPKRTPIFWCLSACVFTSAAGFAWFGDFLCFLALVMSTFLVGYKAYFPKLNFLAFPFVMFFNYLSFPFRAPLLHKWLVKTSPQGGWVRIAITYVLIPALFVSIFLLVYRAASEKFASMLTLNWNADFLQIIALSVGGFVFMFCYTYYVIPKPLIYINARMGDQFSDGYAIKASKNISLSTLTSQQRSGEVSLILLNALLIFFMITYAIEQFGNGSNADSISSDVHERVYVLILSIAMAILVIMIYFKGLLNFVNSAKLLKVLSYIWIALNALLIILVTLKNIEYVNAYGLTFKRIGVFIFLLLSFTGLLLTSVKLFFSKTNIYLLNRMAWVVFSTLVIGSCINWSWMVTKYNTSHFNNPDWQYLQSLTYNKKILKTFGQLGVEEEVNINHEKQKSFLSQKLYYQFLKTTP